MKEKKAIKIRPGILLVGSIDFKFYTNFIIDWFAIIFIEVEMIFSIVFEVLYGESLVLAFVFCRRCP